MSRQCRKTDDILVSYLISELVDKQYASKVGSKSHMEVEWKCDNPLHPIWKASFATRISGHGCPYCSGRLPVFGESDLKTAYPQLYDELVDKSVNERYTLHSAKAVEWICPVCNEVWTTSVRCRTEKGVGCPSCNNRKIRIGEKQGSKLVKNIYPDLLQYAVDPDFFGRQSVGSGQMVEFLCQECSVSHTYYMSVRKFLLGQRCPIKAGRVAVPGINDLATVRPDLAKQLVDESLATELTVGSDRKVEWQCEKGHRWLAHVYSRTGTLGTGCPYCSFAGTSGEEQDFIDTVKNMIGPSISVIEHDTSILGGKELDLVIPFMRIAFEYNGVIWHSTMFDNGKLSYHKDKTDACHKKGYRLIYIWSDDWLYKRSVVISMIRHKLGLDDRSIGARKLRCVEVFNNDVKMFLEENHIQGFVLSSRVFALVDEEGRFHAVICLRSPRNSSRQHRAEGEWEIVRYATDVSVPGGFSKLLSYAEKVFYREGVLLKKWISFSSNDASDGTMYEKCGFVHDADLPPDYKIVGKYNRWVRQPKEAFQKKRFKTDKGLIWEEGWTESECLVHNGLYRVYDSGKVKWEKEV